MKILVAGHTGEPVGGIAIYCEDFLQSNIIKKVDLSFVETSGASRKFSERGLWNLSNLLDALKNTWRFYQKLRAIRPEIIHIITAFGPSFLKHGFMSLIARSMGMKTIIHPRCSIKKILPENAPFWRKFVFFVFRHCDGIIVLSREWLVLEESVSCPVIYIPNGINLQSYLSIPRPSELPDNEKVLTVLYLGHISTDKGSHDLIKAVKILSTEFGKKFKVIMAGEESIPGELQLIQESISNNNLNDWFEITSPKYGQDKISAFTEADIFILPSHHEGMPISLIEAMAAGLPIIATNVGGIPDMVLDGNTGYLVDSKHPVKLANALGSLIKNPRQANQLGLTGRKRAEQEFNMEHVAEQVFNFYNVVFQQDRQ